MSGGLEITEEPRGKAGTATFARRLNNRQRYETVAKKEGQQPGDVLKSIEGYVLFISKLPEACTEGDLLDLFARYGEVRNYRLMTHGKTGKANGAAFVEFGQWAEAEAAIGALHNVPVPFKAVEGGSVALSVAPCFVVEEEEGEPLEGEAGATAEGVEGGATESGDRKRQR